MSVKLDFEIDSETRIDVSSVLDQTTFTEDDIDVVLVKTNHVLLATDKPSFERKLLGRSMIDWVKNALNDSVKLVDDGPTLDVVRPALGKKAITLVAFADTPLLFYELIVEMLNDVNMAGGAIKNFGGAYMGATEEFKKISVLPKEVEAHWKNLEYLRHVTDFVSLTNAENELHDRIIYSHMKSGVCFSLPKTILVDATVKIGKNVTIGPNNVLRGNTKIGDNVVLEANNIVENSVIESNCSIIGCVIKNSKIDKNSKIKPFSVIENA